MLLADYAEKFYLGEIDKVGFWIKVNSWGHFIQYIRKRNKGTSGPLDHGVQDEMDLSLVNMPIPL